MDADRDTRELDGAWTRHQTHTAAAPALADVVERFWTVDWDYATPYRQKVVPLPNVHVTAVCGATPSANGVLTRYAERVLTGRGRVVGARFRAGTFRSVLSTRTLQRLFAEHVGVGPKWVIRRFRLHEVTERMERREPIAWATLVADLGYADQAHHGTSPPSSASPRRPTPGGTDPPGCDGSYATCYPAECDHPVVR